MKTLAKYHSLTVWLLGICLLTAPNVWARLPKPIQTSGTVLAVDLETKSIVFKVCKEKKPVVSDWNQDTEFLNNGQLASPAILANGTRVLICYRYVSFHNPMLKKVIWQTPLDNARK